MDAGSFDLLRGLQNMQGGIRDVINNESNIVRKGYKKEARPTICACVVKLSNISKTLYGKLINY